VVLRTSRFFPEPDDDPDVRGRYEDLNLKANEYLHRRLDLADAVEAHLAGGTRAGDRLRRFIVAAPRAFKRIPRRSARGAPAVVAGLFPDYEAEYGGAAGQCSRRSTACT
jgi:UDP-glucose 4-epimerase